MIKVLAVTDTPSNDFIKDLNIFFSDREYFFLEIISYNIMYNTDLTKYEIVLFDKEYEEKLKEKKNEDQIFVFYNSLNRNYHLSYNDIEFNFSNVEFFKFLNLIFSYSKNFNLYFSKLGFCFYTSSYDKDWPWNECSKNIVKLTGYENSIFMKNPYLWKAKIKTEDAYPLSKRKYHLISDGMFEFVFRFITKNDGYKWLLSREFYDEKSQKTYGILIDINKMKNSDIKDRSKDKIEYLYSFLNYNNHDFQNIISSLIGYVSILESKIPKNSIYYNDFLEVVNLVDRLKLLMDRYLLFMTKETIKKEIIDINQIIDSINKIIRALIRKDIKGIIEIKDKNLKAVGDTIIFQQALCGLSVYLSEVILPNGVLKIKAERVNKKVFSIDSLEYKDKSFVMIRISGNTHISNHEIKDIYSIQLSTNEYKDYSPFSILNLEKNLEKMDSWMEVGVNDYEMFFDIYMPVFSKNDVKDVEPSMRYSKIKKIIIAEDDDGLRRFVSRILRENGYQVFMCNSVTQIINILKSEPDIDLIFTDVELEDGNATDIINDVKNLNPSVKIIFNSGYMDFKTDWENIQSLGFKFIQKPYTIKELLSLIDSELNNLK